MSARCSICPRNCLIEPGKFGACGARTCIQDNVVHADYGLLSAIHVDPIEKKPLHHYLPGSNALSLGSFGCNLMCRGCQNYSISRARCQKGDGFKLSPDEIIQTAKTYQCQVIAYTYNEPIIWAEFVCETAKKVKAAGLKNIMVTAGYVTQDTAKWLFSDIDGANVDLKGFSEDFYKTWANGSLQPVLETLEYLHSIPNFWLEITTLLIPGINDDPQMLKKEFEWIAEHLAPTVPVHLSAFHPDYKALDIPATPAQTILQAKKIAEDVGLKFIYPGNVRIPADTRCPSCNAPVIRRQGYHIEITGMTGDRCSACQTKIPGVFI